MPKVDVHCPSCGTTVTIPVEVREITLVSAATDPPMLNVAATGGIYHSCNGRTQVTGR